MFKIFTIGAAGIAAIIAVVLAYAATQPDRFQVQRSTSIKASADKIFPLISNLQAFNTWNPYDKKDPNIKGTYSGPVSGKGASYGFESPKVGTGRIEILDTESPAKVIMRLTMIKPLEADNRVTFTLEPQGEVTQVTSKVTTKVTWVMEGAVPFVGKIIHLIFNIDKMVGNDFETGLAELKSLAENLSSPKG
jgi:Polyketide cyclase / dehydrase and lipid transport